MGTVGRLFIAVPLTDETRHAIAARLADTVGDRPLPGRPVPPTNWHLTLRFLGAIDEVSYDRILSELDAAPLGKPFRVGFDRLGAFPSGTRATVLWAGVGQGAGELAALAAAVAEALGAAGVPPEDRPYSAHLTLSRIRPHQDVRPLLAGVPSLDVRQQVTRIVVYRSHLGGRRPAVYEELESFDLS